MASIRSLGSGLVAIDYQAFGQASERCIVNVLSQVISLASFRFIVASMDDPFPSASIEGGAMHIPPRILIASNFYHEDVYAGAMAYAREHGWYLDCSMIRSPGFVPKKEDWAGILSTVTGEPLSTWVFESDCPVVCLLQNDSLLNRPQVLCDLESIGRCGAQHLLELGNVNFGFYRYFDAPQSTAVYEGFVREIEAHGFPVLHIDFGMPAVPPGYRRTTQIQRLTWLAEKLAKARLPIAVMAEDDRYAVELAMAARALGFRVPEDIAILGSENQALVLEAAPFSISSVDTNFYEVGWRGADLLNRLLHGSKLGSPEVPMVTKVVPRGVAVRDSTATFACDHPGVTEAALFVRRYFREAINLTEIAKAARMSPRSLQSEYPTRVGRSIREDILRQRLIAAQSLLERTNLKLAAIAAESGLRTVEQLCRVFQREYGMTPNAWRLERGIRGVRDLAGAGV